MRKAAKDYPEHDIKKGDTIYKWNEGGKKVISKKPPDDGQQRQKPEAKQEEKKQEEKKEEAKTETTGKKEPTQATRDQMTRYREHLNLGDYGLVFMDKEDTEDGGVSETYEHIYKDLYVKLNVDGNFGNTTWEIWTKGMTGERRKTMSGVGKAVLDSSLAYYDIQKKTPTRFTPPTLPKGPGSYPKGKEWVQVDYLDVSDDFKGRMKKAVKEIPDRVQESLDTADIRIKVGKSLVHIFPDLANMSVRGWSKGSKWHDVDGVYRARSRAACVGETKTGGAGRGEGVLFHEVGHAFDHSLVNPAGEWMSHTRAFKRAYRADVKEIPTADHGRLAYFLQRGNAGREECFAEVFAYEVGTGCAGPWADVRSSFPRVTELMQKTIKEGKKPAAPKKEEPKSEAAAPRSRFSAGDRVQTGEGRKTLAGKIVNVEDEEALVKWDGDKDPAWILLDDLTDER